MPTFKSPSKGGKRHFGLRTQYKLVETHKGRKRDLQKGLSLDEAQGQLQDHYYEAVLTGEPALLLNHGFTVQLAAREIACVEQPIPFYDRS